MATVLCLGALVVVGVRQAESLPLPRLGGAAWAVISAAVVLHLGASILAALSWGVWLRSLGQSVPWAATLGAHLLSQVGKYVPGNWGHLVGRAALSLRDGATLPAVSAASVLEGSWLLAGSLAWALSIPSATAELGVSAGIAASGGWIVLLLGFLAPRELLRRSVGRLAGRFPRLARHLVVPSRGALLACLGAYSVNFVLGGVTLALLTERLFGLAGPGLLQMTGVFAVAWGVGFVAPGAPGGLGVREAILVGLLAPSLGAGEALAVAAALRVVTTVGDGIAASLGWRIRSR